MSTSSLTPDTRVSRVPRGRAGWWHEYVCPTHGSELQPGAQDREGAPTHTCPHGCVVRGEPYEGAWQVLELQRCAREFRELAHRYAADGRLSQREEARELLTEFCAIYADAAAEGWSEGAASWMLRGKLFHQALTEAIWGTSLAHGVLTLVEGDLRWSRSSRDLDQAADLFAGLLATVTEARRTLVEDRLDLRNNYTAWLICAGVSSARVLTALGRETEVDSWLDGPSGLWAHLDAAIHDDGWEWEGSTYYHFFVLRAYLLALRGHVPAAVPEGARTKLVAMLRVLVALSTERGVLPVLNDGPYCRTPALQELLEVSVLGRQLVELAGLESLEHGTRALLGPSGSSLEDRLVSWFAGTPVATPRAWSGPRESIRFADAGHLVLRSGAGRWQAVTDAGPHGGAHAHAAKLALYLYGDREVWQPAPGVPPYGSALRHGYYARTVAHPTVRVDGVDQADTSGHVVVWEASSGSVQAVVSAPDAFDGADFQRHLLMQDEWLLDAVLVRSTQERTVVLGLRPADRLDAHEEDGVFLTTWKDAGAGAGAGDERGRDLYGCHAGPEDSAFATVPVRGPSHDPARVLTGVDWSARGTATWLVSLYQPASDPTLPRPRLRIVSSTDAAVVVEATPADGRAVIVRLESASAVEPSSASAQRRVP